MMSCARAAQKCPDARLYLASSAVVAATMYMFGGDEGPSVPTYPTAASKYSMLADSWTSAAKAPTWGSSRTYSGGPTFGSAAAVGSRIFYVGGAVPPYGVNEVYETTTDSWTTAKAAPISVAQGTLLSASGNLVYALAADFPITVAQQALHTYSATTDQWTSRAPPAPSCPAECCARDMDRAALAEGLCSDSETDFALQARGSRMVPGTAARSPPPTT
jgi:hypothetical protein